MTFPAVFVLEILSTSLVPLAAAGVLAQRLDLPVLAAVMAVAAFWYGTEALLALSADWHLSWWWPLAAPLRDLMVPLLWAHAWLGSTFTWRGNEVAAHRALSQIG